MRLFLLLLFFQCNSNAFSQIVNIENQRLNNDAQGFSGSAEFNLNFTMNTRQLWQIGARIRTAYVKKKHQFLVLGDHSFVKSEGADFVNRGFQHFRYNYTFKDSGRFGIEAFQQIQFNKVQKINLRLLFGSGLRWNLIDKKNYQLTFGTGVMAEYEELLNMELTQGLLSTSYLSFDGQFNESVGINTISYFQPTLSQFGNFRFSNETALRFKINEHLSFNLIYSITHDSRDILGVRKTNYIFRNTLRIKF